MQICIIIVSRKVILMIEKLSKLVGLWEVEYLVTIRFTVENKELFNDMMGE